MLQLPKTFRRIFPFLLLCSLSLAGGVSPAAGLVDQRPNIVLVMADDQGWGDMAYQGHPEVKTPNFDEAAKAGIRFNRFYAAAPVCSPTRASVMTGRHPNRMGVFQWGYPIRPQETTIAEVLKKAGYATAHFGKWHLGSVRKTSPANPGQNGFDEWLSAPNFYDNDPILSHRGKAVKMKGESSIVAADAAIEWMRQQQQADQPFLCVVWFGSPHLPHRAVPEDRRLYADQPPRIQNFLGEITGMDRAFGKIRQSLRDLGIHDNTVLWYCSDNGALPNVGSTGGFRGHKGKIYEGGLLVPAIIEWPARFPQPLVTEVRATTCDIFPTVLAMPGIESADDRPLDGINLLPILTDSKAKRPTGLGFWNYPKPGISTPSDSWMTALWLAQQDGKDLPPHSSSQNAAQLPSPGYSNDSFPGHSAWIFDHWKLHRIEDKQGDIRWELYNLQSDPYEKEDLSEAEPEKLGQLQKKLESWLKSVVSSLNGDDYR